MKVWRTHWGVWCHVEKQKEIKRFKNHSRIEKTYCPEREPEERHEQRRSVPSWYAVHQEAAIIWNDNTWEVNAVSTVWKARVLWIGRVHNAPQSTEVLCNMNSIDELNWCTELETILNDSSEDDSTETEQHAYSVLQWHRLSASITALWWTAFMKDAEPQLEIYRCTGKCRETCLLLCILTKDKTIDSNWHNNPSRD